MDLGERQKQILSLIIEQFVKTGEPVGSKRICELLPFPISSATIRNEMSGLSDQGLLEQRHTSGGRIPSQRAYRYYVNNIMLTKQMTTLEIDAINSSLSANAGDPERLLADTTRLLAKNTGCASFYTRIAYPSDCVQGVELIPAGNRKCMIVMLTTSGIIKSSVCFTDCDIDEKFREIFYNIVKKKLVGTPLSEVTMAKIQGMSVELGDMIFPMVSVLTSISVLCNEASRREIFIDGETNLLSHMDFGDNVYPLLSFLTSKEQFENILNKRLETGSEKEIFIGGENEQYELSNCTMVISKYCDGERRAGVIGILGSTRLDYAQLIPKFDYITTFVGKLLSERGSKA